MHAIKPVIQLAKERALFRFSALALRMLQDAGTTIAESTRTAQSLAEQKTIAASKEFLAVQGTDFLARLNVSYIGYVERGMQTMYHDLRQGLHDISADTLTLMDDDTVTRQIEVERRVLRLRDADQQSLGRLNLMIAQLHGEHDVRERENPFRPYLMARALHDVLCEMSRTTDICAMLFDHMSGALALQLPDYFAAIREVFESNGVQARLLARPSAPNRRDREMLATYGQDNTVAYAPGAVFQNTGMPAGFAAGLLPSQSMDRILSLLQQKPSDANSIMPTPQTEKQTALQDFVWKIFNQSVPGRIPSNPRYPEGASGAAQGRRVDNAQDRHPLFDRLSSLQKEAIAEGAIAVPSVFDAQEVSVKPRDLQTELETEKLSELDRVSIDIVSMLFNFIAADSLIPPAFRAPILQLQVPFLKAAMLAPDILQQADHPVRQLLNRMASVAIGLRAETATGMEIRGEMDRIADSILRNFDEDLTIFSDALDHFNLVVAGASGEADDDAGRAVAALKDAEKNPQQHDILIVQTVNALRERLSIMEADRRAVDFIVKTWSRVLVHASEHAGIDGQPYLEVVPDLLWSVQGVDAGERSTLMRLLPKLVQRVKSGLQLIGMSDEEARPVMDELVAMHAEVLRTLQSERIVPSIPLADLHRHFSTLKIGGAAGMDASAIHAPTVPRERLQAALRKFNVSAHLHLDSDIGTLQSVDVKWLGGMQPGISIEWWHDNGYLPATLVWVDQQQSFYLFKLANRNEPKEEDEGSARLLIYSSIALIKGLREGSVGMAEAAPVFDRAIESLLQDAGDPASPASF